MRWLLRKDLQILRRSPLLVGLLLVYPIAISLLIGFALSRGPDKPKVAFVNQVPEAQQTVSLGGELVNVASYRNRLFERVDAVTVATRAEAVQKVRNGEVLGALVIPEEAGQRLQSAVALGATKDKPTVEVIYAADGPLQGQLVRSLIDSTLAEANAALGEGITKVAAGYLEILLDGGSFSVFGQSFDVLGLRKTERVIAAQARSLPPSSPRRAELVQVQRFARLAVENLDFSDEIFDSVANPIAVRRTAIGDVGGTSLATFAVAASVVFSLLFVCVLLAAGMLALEREEHTYARLVRGLVSRTTLLVEKVTLAALAALPVGLVMLGVVALLANLDARRAPWWVLVTFGCGAAFGALGVALGAAAREVRAASLLAFGIALPIAFLALVPSGSVGATLFDVVSVVNAAFPFKPALRAMDAALHDNGNVWGPLAHLAALTVVFTGLARLALRRFG